METTPSAAELLEAATEAIRAELLPALSGRAAFQARVAINVLETARRFMTAIISCIASSIQDAGKVFFGKRAAKVL